MTKKIGKYIAIVKGYEYYEEGITGANRWDYIVTGGFTNKKDFQKSLKNNNIKKYYKKPFDGYYAKGSENQSVTIIKASDYPFTGNEDIRIIN